GEGGGAGVGGGGGGGGGWAGGGGGGGGVAVAAGDSDDRARGVDARAGDDALVDSALEPERRPAQVANSREPAQEGGSGLGASEKVQVADVCCEQRCGCGPHQHRVPMHVDQPRHECAPAAVDQDGVRASVTDDWRRRDGLACVPADEDVRWSGQLDTRAVEDANVLDHRRSWRWRLRTESSCEPTQKREGD